MLIIRKFTLLATMFPQQRMGNMDTCLAKREFSSWQRKGLINKSLAEVSSLLVQDTEWVAWLLASWIDAYDVQFGEQVVARSCVPY